MASLYMIRTPGTKDYPALAHLKEGHVYDGVAKADAELLVNAGVAAEFDAENEDHAAADVAYGRADARKVPAKSTPKPPVAETQTPANKLDKDHGGKK